MSSEATETKPAATAATESAATETKNPASPPPKSDDAQPNTTTGTTAAEQPTAAEEAAPTSKEAAESSATKNGVVATAAAGDAAPDDDNYNPEEEVVEGDWCRPQVTLHEVAVKTGEEDEDVFWSHRAKLYRWAKGVNQWKERGIGEAKLLQHKETKKIRFLLRQEKTLKIVANHYVVERSKFCTLTPNTGNDRIWVWTTPDCAESDEPAVEQFGLKFGQVEDAKEFKAKFEDAAKVNAPMFEKQP